MYLDTYVICSSLHATPLLVKWSRFNDVTSWTSISLIRFTLHCHVDLHLFKQPLISKDPFTLFHWLGSHYIVMKICVCLRATLISKDPFTVSWGSAINDLLPTPILFLRKTRGLEIYIVVHGLQHFLMVFLGSKCHLIQQEIKVPHIYKYIKKTTFMD